MHLSQSKGRDREYFLLASLAGASFRSFVPGPRKALGGRDSVNERLIRDTFAKIQSCTGTV